MNILQIDSRARRDASQPTRLAAHIVERLRDADPDATLTLRDLNRLHIRCWTKPGSVHCSAQVRIEEAVAA